jgi:hypothetical protein
MFTNFILKVFTVLLLSQKGFSLKVVPDLEELSKINYVSYQFSSQEVTQGNMSTVNNLKVFVEKEPNETFNIFVAYYPTDYMISYVNNEDNNTTNFISFSNLKLPFIVSMTTLDILKYNNDQFNFLNSYATEGKVANSLESFFAELIRLSGTPNLTETKDSIESVTKTGPFEVFEHPFKSSQLDIFFDDFEVEVLISPTTLTDKDSLESFKHMGKLFLYF